MKRVLSMPAVLGCLTLCAIALFVPCLSCSSSSYRCMGISQRIAKDPLRSPYDGITDEVWVIARPEMAEMKGQEETPGSGAMLAQKGEEKVPLPLKHTDVKGRVCGYIATVEVTQQFEN